MDIRSVCHRKFIAFWSNSDCTGCFPLFTFSITANKSKLNRFWLITIALSLHLMSHKNFKQKSSASLLFETLTWNRNQFLLYETKTKRNKNYSASNQVLEMISFFVLGMCNFCFSISEKIVTFISIWRVRMILNSALEDSMKIRIAVGTTF